MSKNPDPPKKWRHRIKYRCERMIQMKPKPYLQDFTIMDNIELEKPKNEAKSEKVHEPWRKRSRVKKSKSSKNDIGTFKLDKDQMAIQEDHNDVKWDFGVSSKKRQLIMENNLWF